MSAKLVAYEYVPSGFEMVINNPDVEMGKVWNLWWNVKLTDDPEAWDSEIKSINKMQAKLGKLTEDQRLIRAQMAEFCRLNPLFPESIDILCKEIGDGHFSKPVRMGCEGRGLLNSLGYNDPQSLNDQKKAVLTEYVVSLKKWLAQGLPERPIESKVSGFLGQSTNSKKVFVEELVSVIASEELSIFSLKKLSENECREALSKFEALSFRPFNCFRCEGSAAPTPNCQCSYAMILDAGLLCVGSFGEEKSMLDETRRFVEENILAYSSAINSWLKEAPQKPVTSLIDARYMTRDNALGLADRVHSYLGKKDEAKEWLTACLLKTVKDNQRWHKRTEMIDNFPEATSWFEEMP